MKDVCQEVDSVTHALVVGGTGMLRRVSLALARPGKVVSVIARRPQSLETLRGEAQTWGGQIEPIAVDYRNTPSLIDSLGHAGERHGPFDLGVVWIHSTAPEAPLVVASALSDPARPSPYFHVLGSAVADPSQPGRGWRSRFESFPGIEYHEIILGFVPDRHGSRWLTHDEISTGILEAIESGAPRTIIGTVTPWSARP